MNYVTIAAYYVNKVTAAGEEAGWGAYGAMRAAREGAIRCSLQPNTQEARVVTNAKKNFPLGEILARYRHGKEVDDKGVVLAGQSGKPVLDHA